ncbi:MAG: cadherin-like domain-containing protein, partial [Opitutales bacterium]|nr:cadherin-like domain-containing protein [Opitutales bacterium]
MKTKVKYPALRVFIQRYLLKVVFALILIELAIITYYQYRNKEPVAAADESQVYQEYSVDIPVMQNDFDEDIEDELSIVSVTEPANGTLELNNRTVRYTPNPDFTGFDQFTYVITDGKDESDPASVTVQVDP